MTDELPSEQRPIEPPPTAPPVEAPPPPPAPTPPVSFGEMSPDKSLGFTWRERWDIFLFRLRPLFLRLAERPWIGWAVVASIVLMIGAAAFLYAMSAFVHAKKILVVPDLKGKSLSQALDLIAGQSLSIAKAGTEFDESLPAGAVLKQSPGAGAKVREGKVIQLTVSSGGEVVFIPDLTGKPLPEAQNQIRSGGMALGALSEVYSLRHDAGWVMEQNPSSGTVAKRGQMVDLKVSKGYPPEGTLLMPDFIGKPVAQAKAWAQAQNVAVAVETENLPNVLGGLVQRQWPAADAAVKSGVTAKFVASKGGPAAANATTIAYKVPGGSERVNVRITVRDEGGEREVFEGAQDAGSTVEVPVPVSGPARARIFVNGVLIEERPLE